MPGNQTGQIEPPVFAAIDLGSNSFHMVIARLDGRDLFVIDRLREPVRLADGLDAGGNLGSAAVRRAILCLERFGQRTAGISPGRLRAVGTNALRRAESLTAFRRRAVEALGHDVEVISGHEEARLIYQGVAHTHSYDGRKRLVVDIGGGSTELIVGRAFEVLRADSRGMGCVDFTRKFFPGGSLARENFAAAALAAALKMRPDRKEIRSVGWEAVVGSSGTINAVSSVLASSGYSDGRITLAGIEWLVEELVRAGTAGAIDLPGLSEERKPVFAAGVAILSAVFRSLRFDSMSVSSGALREGVLYDLVGRSRRDDVRSRTIRRLMRQYNVDGEQAVRVEKAARLLLKKAAPRWATDEPRAGTLLTRAASLHEIGLAVSHSEYNRHSEYLLVHSDMPGFSRDEQALLAILVRSHRKRLVPGMFEGFTGAAREEVIRLCILFRLAVLLHRSRQGEEPPPVDVRAEDRSLAVSFRGGWLDGHPLTRADLEKESARLKAIGYRLDLA